MNAELFNSSTDEFKISYILQYLHNKPLRIDGLTIYQKAYIIELLNKEYNRLGEKEDMEKERTNQFSKITIEEVANRIWGICKISPEHGNVVMDLIGDEAYNKIMDIVKQYKKRTEFIEWKTTTDLPEEGEENIVLASIGGNVEVGYFLTLDELEDADGETLDEEVAFFSVDEVSSWGLNEVDAWMPLPKPY